MQAIVQNDLNSLRQYLLAGFDLNQTTSVSLPDKNSFLHWACMYANEQVVRLLLENGTEVNSLNKHGASALHEVILRKSTKEEKLGIIETLLIYKSDPVNIKPVHGVYKDQSALELAQTRAHIEPEVFNLIKEFLNDISSTNTSVPHSPLVRSLSETQQTSPKSQNQIQNAIESLTHNDSNSSFTSTSRKSISNEFEQLQNWCSTGEDGEKKPDLKSLLWPQPQFLTILSENENDRFYLPNVKTQPLFIYFKPPYTYSYMDLVNKLASAFSGILFYCVHKPIETPFISVNIDKNLFQHQSSYSILVTNKKIEINAFDSIALQYAFFTFMQLCKIYSRQSIPSLRVILKYLKNNEFNSISKNNKIENTTEFYF